MARICEVDDCYSAVFGTDRETGVGYCKYHQFMRTDKQPYKAPQKPINPISQSRKDQLPSYNAIRSLYARIQREGNLKCFFTNKKIKYDFDLHHLLGRDGDLFNDKEHIVPVLRKFHRQYHDMNIAQLSKTHWYAPFLVRIMSTHPEVHKKEMNKLFKADYMLNIEEEKLIKRND